MRTVLNNLATVYDSLKQYGTAERYYRKALKIDPHSALVLRNFGSNQLTQHKYKKGWEAYQSALKSTRRSSRSRSAASVENPASTQDRGAMHYYMARGCVSAGNSECAIQNLRLALNEGYTNPRKIANDSSFASLRELPAFQQLIAAQSAPSITRKAHSRPLPVVSWLLPASIKTGHCRLNFGSRYEVAYLSGHLPFSCSWRRMWSESKLDSSSLSGQWRWVRGRWLMASAVAEAASAVAWGWAWLAAVASSVP